jgi:hypothetical protein
MMKGEQEVEQVSGGFRTLTACTLVAVGAYSMANAPIKRWRLLRRLFETCISAFSINY